jgi:hypothetical protein
MIKAGWTDSLELGGRKLRKLMDNADTKTLEGRNGATLAGIELLYGKTCQARWELNQGDITFLIGF